jgi:hypothetical protein
VTEAKVGAQRLMSASAKRTWAFFEVQMGVSWGSGLSITMSGIDDWVEGLLWPCRIVRLSCPTAREWIHAPVPGSYPPTLASSAHACPGSQHLSATVVIALAVEQLEGSIATRARKCWLGGRAREGCR